MNEYCYKGLRTFYQNMKYEPMLLQKAGQAAQNRHQYLKYERISLQGTTCVIGLHQYLKYESTLPQGEADFVRKKRGTGGVPQFNYLSLSHIKLTQCGLIIVKELSTMGH